MRKPKETNFPHHKKLLRVLDQEQKRRGMSQNQFTEFLGFPLHKSGHGGLSNPTVSQWRRGRSTPNFRLILQVWRILGRSLDEDFL